MRIVGVLGAVPGVILDAVVDRRPEALASPALASAARRVVDGSDLFDVDPPDLLCIASNAPSHAEYALRAIRAGVSRILVEKPMACSVAECDRMIEAAEGAGVRLAVDHGRRYAPLYQWIQGQIAAKRWGEPRAVWIQRPGIGLGCLATHSFDLAAFLIGRPPVAVTGWVDRAMRANPRGPEFNDPGGTVVMDFGDGIRAVIAQIEDGSGPMSVEVDLTSARIRIDESSGSVEILERDRTVVPAPGRAAVFSHAAVPADVDSRVDMGRMIAAVLRELMGTGPIAADGECGRLSIEVLTAAYVSHDRGQVPIRLPLAVEHRDRWLPIT